MGPVEPSSHTTTPNPQLITYHNSQPPYHHIPQRPTETLHIPQLPTPNLSHTTTHNLEEQIPLCVWQLTGNLCIPLAQHMSSLIMKWVVVVVVHLWCQPQDAVWVSVAGQQKDSTIIFCYNTFAAEPIITNFVLPSPRHVTLLICTCSIKLYW